MRRFLSSRERLKFFVAAAEAGRGEEDNDDDIYMFWIFVFFEGFERIYHETFGWEKHCFRCMRTMMKPFQDLTMKSF